MSNSSVAPAASPGATARSGSRRWAGPTVITIVILVAVLLGGYVLTRIFGNVLGTEFCPETFERRTFAFCEIPYTGIQVTGIQRDVDAGVVELHMIQKGYLVPIQPPAKTWHLVSLIRFRCTWVSSDANLLITYLDAKDGKEEYGWLNWSDAHPELAKILWPAVAKAARAGNYVVVPELFSEARAAASAQELQKKLDAALAKRGKSG